MLIEFSLSVAITSLTWVTEGGDLSTADWGCLAGRCASLCLQAAHDGLAAGGFG